MSIYDSKDGWDHARPRYVSSRKAKKPMGPEHPHYPNKAERVLLIQMMRKSGQTEEQIRSNKDNRRKLAEAQQSMGAPIDCKQRKTRLEYEAKRQLRSIARCRGVNVWELK